MKGLAYAVATFFMIAVKEALSYPLLMIDRAINLGALVTLLYLGSKLVAEDGVTVPLPAGYFLFGVTGLAVMQVFSACLTAFRFRIRQFQLSGMLESFVMTRTRLWQILLATPSYELCASVVQAILLVALAHGIAGVGVDPLHALMSLGVLFLGCSSFLCVGLIAACAVLVLKRGEPLTRLVSLATFLFSGAFFPRALLPTPLAEAAGWLPVAPTLDALRVLLHGETTGMDLGAATLRLALITVLLIPFVVLTYRLAARRVMRDGSLGHY